MNFVNRQKKRVVVRQVPILLLVIGALFSFPMIGFSLYSIFGGIEAEGQIFGLLFGLLILWLFLEFVGTRERIEIDSEQRTLTRTVSGVFRNTRQAIGLREAREFRLENVTGARGGEYQHLYLYANDKKYLLNSPGKRYLDHGRLGRLLSEAAGLPYRDEKGSL
jgi:hypothetical protein